MSESVESDPQNEPMGFIEVGDTLRDLSLMAHDKLSRCHELVMEFLLDGDRYAASRLLHALSDREVTF